METKTTVPTEMSIQLSGRRIPFIALTTLLGTLIASVVYATIWLTKLDDRVLNNNGQVSENRETIERINDTQKELQLLISKTVTIQEHLLDKIEKLEK